MSFCVAGTALRASPGAALGAPPGRSAEIRRRLSYYRISVLFCVAGAALGGPHSHFA